MARPIVGRLELFIKPLLCFLKKVVHIVAKIFIFCDDVAAASNVETESVRFIERVDLKFVVFVGLYPEGAVTKPVAVYCDVEFLLTGRTVRDGVNVGGAHDFTFV